MAAKPTIKKEAGVVVVEVPSTPSRRRRSSSTPSVPQAPKKRRSRRRGGSRKSKVTKERLFEVGLGGLIYAYVEKHFPNLPTVPVLGRSGTIAIGAYYLGGDSQIAQDVALSAAVIAGYTLGSTGSIAGDGDVISRQM